MEGEEPSPSPLPNLTSSVFKDISNFKTPKRPLQKPNFQSPLPNFFTASKQTPSSSSSAFIRRPSICPSSNLRRRPSICPSSRSKATRRLKAFELEQSQSCRKALIRKEKSLKSLSKSLSTWLNFLFENPKACGCDISLLTGGADRAEESSKVSTNGKRDSGIGIRVSIDGPWRSPKRQKDCSISTNGEELVLSSSMFSSLQVSLQEVCSFEDLKQRMREYLSLDSCKEVFSVMSQVTKVRS